MPFPKIPLPGGKMLTGHVPAPPANPNPTLVQRLVSHLPLKVRARKPEEGGQRPRAELPDHLWLEIVPHMDPLTRAAFRQTSKAAATIAAETVKSIVVRRPADLIPALTAYGRITKLTASNISLGTSISELQQLAANTSITSLDLNFNQISDAGARYLATNTSITSLNLSCNKIGPAGAKALANNTSITSLDLDMNKIKEAGAKALAESTSITSLKLAGNEIRDAGARHLAANTSITSLGLNSNDIGDAGAQALAANTSITSLDLRGNNIGDAGAQALANNLSITSLDLRSNKIGDAGRRALEAVRHRFKTLLL